MSSDQGFHSIKDSETGFCFPNSVEKTEDKGLGVFAREKIKKGSIVWRHVPGVFVVYDEHSFRAMIEKMPPADVVYELTHVHAFEDFPGCLIRALDDGILINHSNDPSLATNKSAPAKMSFDADSRRYLQRVAEALLDDRYSLVATRDIEPGEELANDYSLDDDCPPYYDILDNFDSYLIGGFQYILDTGYVGMGISIATIPVTIIGIKTANIRIHNVMATIFFGWQILIGFGHLEILSP